MELNDFAAQQEEEPESGTSSPSGSFPDRYLVPYIEWCKRSKRTTCGCSIMFIGLAILSFFATNYLVNYPVTESRKIAFVFAGICCIIAAVYCLDLRFRIWNECRSEASNNTLFEITRREDTAFSDSFSGHFEMESPVAHGTPREEPSQSETPDNSSSVAHSDNESFRAPFTEFRYNARGRLPRHSISDTQSPDIPLLPLRRSGELSRPSEIQNATESTQLHFSVIVPGSNNYPAYYSTFQKSQLVLLQPELELDFDSSETEPLLAESSIDDSYEETETEPLLVESSVENAYEATETENLLVENALEAAETEPQFSKPSFENSSEASKTEPLLAESSCESAREESKPKTILVESTFENDFDLSDIKKSLI